YSSVPWYPALKSSSCCKAAEKANGETDDCLRHKTNARQYFSKSSRASSRSGEPILRAGKRCNRGAQQLCCIAFRRQDAESIIRGTGDSGVSRAYRLEQSRAFSR